MSEQSPAEEWGNEPAQSEDSQPQGEASAPTQPETLADFHIQDLSPAMREGLQRQGWADLMPVQARAIPYIMARRDLMIQSRTGSGKTGAYLIPIFERINPEQNATQAMILVPTRELAVQVAREAQNLSAATAIRVVAVYGGVRYGEQLDAFRQGAHVVIGTPGRILDHLMRRSLTLDKLRMIVFDEADRMLSMGFYPDMKRVQRYLPEKPINSYMFSATFPPRVLALAHEFMRSPDFLNLSSDHVHVTETEHIFYTVPPMDKERSLVRIVEIENPASALIFCNTRERVHFVNVILQRYGYQSDEISSDLSQSAREEVMEHIRQGRLRFLVATDVAARGIDLPELSHVILYEPPEDAEAYIHRAGRTGRAGSSGVAISLVNALEKVELLRIGRRYTMDLQERSVPTEEEVQGVVAERTEALLAQKLRGQDQILTDRMQRFVPFLQRLNEDDQTAAGVAMLLDEFYHHEFHTAQLPQIAGSADGEKDFRKGEKGRGARRSDEPNSGREGQRPAGGGDGSRSRRGGRPRRSSPGGGRP